MAIVVSHIAGSFDTLAASALRQAQLADVVELRLDRCGHPGEAALRAFMKECPKPVIVAVNGPEAFGSFKGSVDEKCDLLHTAALSGARFVDIDWQLSLELGEVEAPCHRIVSRHELGGTPMDLAAFDEEVRAVLHEGDVVKLVTHARTTEDGLRMLNYVRQARGGLVAFCSGHAGSFTRAIAPVFGSPFTYAAPADLPGMLTPEPTAPGQLRVNDLLGILPPGGLSPETAIFGVVGNPVGQSLSPWVHGMAFKNAHLDALYLRFEPQDFERFLELATDENYRGLSVTAPFKQAAFRASKDHDDASLEAKACNTLLRDGAGWRGCNTDTPAIRDTIELAFKVHSQVPGRPVALGVADALVLGTGGAARAAVRALRALDVTVTLAGRDAAKARALAEELVCTSVEWSAVPATSYDILVHCTPVGSGTSDDELGFEGDWLPAGKLVLDAVYRPIRTDLLMRAKRTGGTPVPGGEWFVRQAQKQFELFTHQGADEALMRAAFEHALQEG